MSMTSTALCHRSLQVSRPIIYVVDRIVFPKPRAFNSGTPPTGGSGKGGKGNKTDKGARDEMPRFLSRRKHIERGNPVSGSDRLSNNEGETRRWRFKGGESTAKLVKDSSDIPILIPGKTTPLATDTKHRARRRKLPIVNASALLDTKTYCRKSAKPGGIVTKSGGDAAKRLLHGKKDLLQLLRGNVVFQQNHRPFCLSGHGVPRQLLQDHLDLADSLLYHHNDAVELSAQLFYDSSLKNLSFEYLTSRTMDGRSVVTSWPPTAEFVEDNAVVRHWEHKMALYLAVMGRIASKLGLAVIRPDVPKNWNIRVLRRLVFSKDVVSTPEDEDTPVPILAWSPLHRQLKGKARMSIYLQGMPQVTEGLFVPHRENPLLPVTLVFDFTFG